MLSVRAYNTFSYCCSSPGALEVVALAPLVFQVAASLPWCGSGTTCACMTMSLWQQHVLALHLCCLCTCLIQGSMGR